MIELEVKNLEKYYGSNLIFKSINFEVQSKEKVAIVGKNGCGKSTVLKVISGYENKDNGEIHIRKNSKIGYLEQIPEFGDLKVKEVLNIAFKELFIIEEKLKELEIKMQQPECNLESVLDKYSKLQVEYENLGGYEKETVISKVCNGLSMNDDFLELNFKDLSGGEKTRAMLGKILIESPDILLLDEPTNHLDMKSVSWLEEYLRDYSKCAIIVSHDRYFLDRVVNKVVEMESLESKTYIGNCSSYQTQKEEYLELQRHNYKEQQKKIHKMEESIKQLKVFSRNGDNENFVKRAKSMQKRLDKMDKMDNPDTKKSTIKMNISNNTKQSQDVVVIENGSKSFESKVLFENIDLLVRKGENVAIIGANGCGKSTLLNIILENDTLDKGNIKVSESSKVGYLPQNIVFEDDEKTILEWFRDDINILEGKAREYLSKYMFYKEDVFKKVKSLSGGEKSRLKLSKILYFDINLLILDEPTNHLDIESIKNLEGVLKEFKGSIIFVSHDRYFINTISSRVIEIDNNTMINYEGDYEYYKEKKEEANYKMNVSKSNTIDENTVNKVKNNTKKINTDVSNKNNTSKDNSFKKLNLEKEMNILEENIKSIDVQLEDSSLEYGKLQELWTEKEIMENELTELLEIWLSL